MSDPSLFDRARKADITAVYGGKLYGSGWKRRGACPLCGHGDRQKTGHAFEINLKGNSWRCYKCNEAGGSVIDLEHLMHGRAGESITDAAKRLAGDAPRQEAVRPAPVIVVPDGPTFSERFAREVWTQSTASQGTIVQRYLLSRGIAGSVLIEALRHLRFHPSVFHSGPRDRPLCFPAMIAQVLSPSGPTGGIHVTYLARDGMGKAYIPQGEKAKKMWGPQHGVDGPGGVWLAAEDGAGPVMLAEGIESALSMAMMHDGPSRPLATLSLGRMQGGWLLDRYGRADPDVPRPDPERPGLTWPVMGASEVIIGVDHDNSPLRVKVRKRGGGTAERMIGATERARICGALTRAAWKRAGWDKVFIAAPPVGMDFNDKLRQEQAA